MLGHIVSVCYIVQRNIADYFDNYLH